MIINKRNRAQHYVSGLAFVATTALFGQAQAATTELLSVNSAQEQANSGTGGSIGFSADGRFAVFESGASNLDPRDTNGKLDVFIRDRLNGLTELVSLDNNGDVLSNGGRLQRNFNIVSANGSLILFCDYVSSENQKLYLRDRSAGQTLLIPDGYCSYFALSADGNWVASKQPFTKTINLFDRRTNTIQTIVPPPPPTGGEYNINNLELSDDGRVVVFNYQTNVYNQDGSYSHRIARAYAYDTETEALSLIKELSHIGDLSVSGDGNHIAFISSSASLLETFPTSFPPQVVVMNRITGEMDVVTLDAIGMPADARSDYPRLNRDGSVVVFDSQAKSLTPPDGSISTNILLFDRQQRQFEVISVNNEGVPGNSGSYTPAISADGSTVGFKSRADNLVYNDTNGRDDLFVRTRDVAPVDPVVVLTEFLATLSVEELDPNLLNSLTATIEHVQATLEKGGNVDEAVNAFVNKVLAQQGKKIDEATAELLIGYAQQI